ncbi:hypothetical protein HYH03_001985 [Edaphochlamys debaryana]|uniref:BTB domain-containing protein n=1 Tax=Edaphochlamys debaryana TaxID=47281 RepID=A0A835YCK1_9CHLO|nr:hypothetical protein HYH03_001985 [Edaphochlamys debaryana]|eukprot:KAG2500415.1 hypothetical protein HYH03_001985 [Edaphochlamys debaryana]
MNDQRGRSDAAAPTQAPSDVLGRAPSPPAAAGAPLEPSSTTVEPQPQPQLALAALLADCCSHDASTSHSEVHNDSSDRSNAGGMSGPPSNLVVPPFVDGGSCDLALCLPSAEALACHSQVLTAWSSVFRDLLSGLSLRPSLGSGPQSPQPHSSYGPGPHHPSPTSPPAHPPSTPRQHPFACPTSTTTTTTPSGTTHAGIQEPAPSATEGRGRPAPAHGPGGQEPGQHLMPLPLGDDCLSDWWACLELMYPPTALPRPAVGWANIDAVIRIADKYGMYGMLLLAEEFLLGRCPPCTAATPGGGGGPGPASPSSSSSAPHGAGPGYGCGCPCRCCAAAAAAGSAASGAAGASAAAGAAAAAGAGGCGVFSAARGEPGYVLKWLGVADRLRMERVVARCIDFLASEAMAPPPPSSASSAPRPAGAPGPALGGAGPSGPGPLAELGLDPAEEGELLARLRPSTLVKLVGRLAGEASAMRAALRNDGMRLGSSYSWSYAPGSPGGAGASIAEHRRWQLAISDPSQCRWRLRSG